jgi:hypothetical protein
MGIYHKRASQPQLIMKGREQHSGPQGIDGIQLVNHLTACARRLGARGGAPQTEHPPRR